ncbi:hypothetical protein HDU92_004741 [Lobulomyces angularis]|nr:hypothetical protein HDU92_004741 [Lobulomyces angularis]
MPEQISSNPKIPTLFDHGLNSKTGFLPRNNVASIALPNFYRHWDYLFENLIPFIRDRTIRTKILELPMFTVDNLETEADWDRAYLVLSFLGQTYIWGDTVNDEVLTVSILD